MTLFRAARAGLALAALAAAATPLLTPAEGAALQAAAPFRQTLSIPSAVERTTCATTRLAGRSGVATTTWTPSAPVALRAALSGARSGDWDLAVFDRATGRRLGGSAGWGADEVVTADVPAGRQLDIQACRLSGPSTSAQLEISSVVLPLRDMGKLPPAPKVVDIELPNRGSLGLLEALNIDLADNPHAHGGGTTAIIYNDDELALLRKAGFKYRVVIPDLNAFDRVQQARTERYAALMKRDGSPLPSGRSEYRNYEDFGVELKGLADQYPALVRPVTLPTKTFQGREQTGVEISSDVQRTDDQKPVTLLVGLHHAREWPSAEIMLEMAYYLAKGFGSDAQVTELLKHVRVVIVPIINPDGYVSSRTATSPSDELGAPPTVEGAGNGGILAYRRKNCKGELGPTAPCDLNGGVDPNRNYGFGWGGRGASTQRNSQTYRGSGPFSEEETQGVHGFSQVHDVTSMLTMHNFASLVLRPPGRHTDGLAPDEDALKALGDAMANDTGYTSQYGWQLYDTSGTTEDWSYGAAGTFGYTIELGPASADGGNFHISYDRGVIEQWVGPGDLEGRGVRRALLRMIEAGARREHHVSLVGRAPAGRVLRVHKDFKTATSEICSAAFLVDLNLPPEPERPDACAAPTPAQEFDDKLDYTTRVPANGVFSWIITPSTRPFEYKAGRRETWTLTCEDDAGTVYETKQVEAWRGDVRSFEMPCGGTIPTGTTTPQTVEQAASLELIDKSAPRTEIARRQMKFSRRRIVLGGGTRDRAPQGLRPRVAKVQLFIAKRAGKRCRFLDDQGGFGPREACTKATTLHTARVRTPAATATRWTYSIGARLPKGRYFVLAQGIDASGNVERRRTRNANLVRFTIR